MKGLWLLIVGLIIGLVVGYWFWRGRSSAGNTATVEVQAIGKSFLYPQQGDVLKWTDSQGKPLPVTFQFGSPCKEAETSATCEIVADSGYFKYTCPTCLDPGVRVGSHGTAAHPGTNPTVDSVGATGAVNTAEPPDPFVYCDPGKRNVATAQTVTAHVNDKVQWFPASQIAGQRWQITVGPGVCQEGPIFTPPSPGQPTGICTVLKTATYQVEADACQIKQGTAQLTVQ